MLLERAGWQLSRSAGAITEIALDAQYGSLEAFTRAFRKAYGVSPSIYRRMGLSQFRLAGASGVHFVAPGCLSKGAFEMDLFDRFAGHESWHTRKLLEHPRQLTDDQLDRPIATRNAALARTRAEPQGTAGEPHRLHQRSVDGGDRLRAKLPNETEASVRPISRSWAISSSITFTRTRRAVTGRLRRRRCCEAWACIMSGSAIRSNTNGKLLGKRKTELHHSGISYGASSAAILRSNSTVENWRPLLETIGFDLGLQLLEARHGRRKTFFVLPVEEDAAEGGNGFKRAPAAECDHRFSAGQRFDGVMPKSSSPGMRKARQRA